MKDVAILGDDAEACASEQRQRLIRERRLDRRESEVARRELSVSSRERVLAARLGLAQVLLAAARVRDAASEELDTCADQRERDLDLAQMLSPSSDAGYGADWPARRHAMLGREQAKADRLSSHMDLTALVAACGECVVESP